MRKSLHNIFIYFTLAVFIFSSCKDDSYLKNVIVPNQSFVEEFDTASAALARGWQFINNSELKGGGVWQNGGSLIPLFAGYSNHGTYAGFIGTDYTSTSAAAAIISNWLISPPVILQNGDKIIFYTRSQALDNGAGDSTDYGNSLQVNINTHNSGIFVGNYTDVGDFDKRILAINPTFIQSSYTNPVAGSYPTRWTRFEATVAGVNSPVLGRFAFRYFVQGGGSNGLASGIGIDSVAYQSVKK
ncbi:MAG: choice-of-anchor J domain-containing protein [Chitinophagaceae bacterium]|nr:choice-of-anchor J domain-containing protein [Chitinophagaceae bacterium]